MADQRQVVFREIDSLKQVLPISGAILKQQDRASVLRVTSAYLSMRDYFADKFVFGRDNIETTSLILQALDCFCFILDEKCRILYITESVSTHLGYSQVQMVGCNMSEFLHPEDFCLLQHVITSNVIVPTHYSQRLESCTQFTLRMTSKLPKRSCGFMFAGYKTILCTGFTRRTVHADSSMHQEGLLACGQMIDKPGSPEIPIRCHQFLLRTTPDLRIVFSDSKVGDILRYNPEDILDLTIYQLITVDDIEPVLKAHMMILREEECQSVTPYVEMLCQGEGLAIVCFHLIKLPSKHSGTMFSISIICTFIGFSSRPTCFSSVQTMRPFDKNEIAGLGAHSPTFYTGTLGAQYKELSPSKTKRSTMKRNSRRQINFLARK